MSLAPGIETAPPELAAGRLVKLEDGRVGIVRFAWNSLHDGVYRVDNAYVIGVGFEGWFKPIEIVKVYGVAAPASTVATTV